MTDLQIEAVAKAMRRAYSLGQTYWQQADSESYSQNRLADATQAKFDALTLETCAALTAQAARLDIGAQLSNVALLDKLRRQWDAACDHNDERI